MQVSATDYTLTLPQNEWLTLSRQHFCEATNGSESSTRTLVRLSYEDKYLRVEFECLDNPYWQSNTYTEHNTELWRQEVFEVFIAAGADTPTRYVELEINPNNALFVGRIHNPTKEGDAMTLDMVPYEQAGIIHEVQTEQENWKGRIEIPRQLIGDQSTTTYRLNFYRIVLREQPATDWECTPDNCSFLCWNSTLSGTTPCFHRPESFGTLQLM
ncbi:carbohydrate-binding family 9-like protein [Telluribacter humicola]|uniref:carbohydrate-binding family 9-like protein n=1 Tax=Telluribacter humicola TaxID=1720261 RepID=UPI001A97887E|nr:carbohydrate-binding family 9-like protein [Telluribacter humicola]